MPIYEYICDNCGTRVEAMRRMSDRSTGPACARCGSERTALALSTSSYLGGSGSGAGGACSTSAWTGAG